MASKLAACSKPLVCGVLLVLAAFDLLLSGCKVVQGVADVPGQAVRVVSGGNDQSEGYDPVELQQKLFRFVDDYAGRMTVAFDSINATTNVLSDKELVQLKLNLADATTAIVTGPNTTMNMLDLFVVVKLARYSVSRRWPVDVYGESVQPLMDACQQGDEQITSIAKSVLTTNQLDELDLAIARWQLSHKDFRSALTVRALGLVTATQGKKDQQNSPGSLFTLLKIDPLSGLDPAARELAETRLFAERALFIAQRAPVMLRWQLELLTFETTETPALLEFRTNSQQVAAALDRTSRVTEQLPELVRSEREAILKSLADQESGLTNVAVQVRATLDEGRQMSDSLNTTLRTFDQLQAKLTAKDTNQPSEPSEPFRIQDYTEAAQQIDAAAQKLTELLVAFDRTLGSTNLTELPDRLAPSIQQAQDSGRDVVDYAFRKAMLLLVTGCVLVTASILLVRRWH